MTIALVCLYGVYRIILGFSIWWSQTSARTIDQANLSRKFHGIILFSLDGGYLDIRPVRSNILIRITKTMERDEGFVFRIDVSSGQISDSGLHDLLTRLGGLGGGEVILHRGHGGQGLSGLIHGPLVSDCNALESVTRSLVSALGFEQNAKFKFKTGGPSNHKAVKEYFGLRVSADRSRKK